MAEDAVVERSSILSPAPETPAQPSQPPVAHSEFPNEGKLVDFVKEMVETSEGAMRSDGSFSDLDAWVDTYWGDHAGEPGPSYRPTLHINELKTLILTEVADLTDGRLRVYITRDPQSGARDEETERGFQATWDRARAALHLVDALLWSFIAPVGYLTALWNPSLAVGQGDLVISARHPWSVKPSPTATDDRMWDYVVLEDVLPLDQIEAAWPNRGGLVRPDAGLDLRYGAEEYRPYGTGANSYYGPLAPRGGTISSSQPTRVVNRARVYSAFYRDHAMEDVPQKLHDDFGKLLGIKSLKKHRYPNGRLTQVAGNTVLYDGPSPYRFFPVIRVITQPAPGRFFPTSTISEFSALQDAAETLDSNLIENAVRLNHGIIVTDTQSGISPDNFQALPGQIVAKRRGSEFDIKYPTAMPPDMVQQPERLRTIMRRIWGATEPRTGQGGRGNVSSELTETEIQQAQALTRLRSRLVHDAVQRLAELIFSIMADFFRSPRIIPYTSGGSWDPVRWQPMKDDERQSYAVHVDPASIRPKSGTLMARLAPLLYRLQAIDEEELLRQLDWPNWKDAAKKAKERQMMAAMAKMAQKKGGKK